MLQETQKLLVIDDSPANLEILSELISDECEVLCSLNGKDGLELALNEQPDLILLDVMMPFMDGYEVCSRLKSDPLTRGIPVIFITALNHLEDEAKGLTLEAIDYLTKPINLPIVHARIRNHLALRRTELALQERTVLLGQAVADQMAAREQLETLNRELEERVIHEVNLNRLKDQALIASDKLASIGLLAAGVAHEINNPMGFITSNLSLLLRSFDKLTRFDHLQQDSARSLLPEERERITSQRSVLDIDFILNDSVDLLKESLSGAERIIKIVQNLKSFSRVDAPVKELVSLP
jgi:two-component system, NtrC family, sensor kinase